MGSILVDKSGIYAVAGAPTYYLDAKDLEVLIGDNKRRTRLLDALKASSVCVGLLGVQIDNCYYDYNLETPAIKLEKTELSYYAKLQ